MSLTANIVAIEKVRHQATGSDFLDVAFTVTDAEGKVIVDRKIALDPASTQEQVVSELAKYVQSIEKEEEQKVAQAELDAIDANVVGLQESLVGKTITLEKVEPKEEEVTNNI